MRSWFLLLTLAGVLSAQELPPVPAPNTSVTQPTIPVTNADLYCAGFIGKPLPKDHFVAAGLETPHQSRFSAGEFIYLQGTGYEPGARVSLVREIRDPNQFSPFEDTEKLLKKTGQMYAELGYAVVQDVRANNIAVAKVEFACESIVPGDQVVAFETKQPVSFRARSTVDRFPKAPSSVTGRIAAARNFEQFLAGGSKIYMNIGNDKGVKPGDYFRIVRGYDRREFDLADVHGYGQTLTEDTQKNPPHFPNNKLKDLPKHVVGEAVVLSTRDTTATAMVSFALEEVHVGDTVELEESR
jgi:hypothetical protein